MKPVNAIPLIAALLEFLAEKGIIAAIINPNVSVKETCDGENICVDIKLEANTSQITVSIIPQYKSNIFLQCSKRPNEEPKCASDTSVLFKYKRETEILQFCMKFNQTKHSENEMVVKRNEEDYMRRLLLPCQADFKAKAVHNKTHVTVTCEHDAFKLSNSGIKIERENNIVAQCVWNRQCIGAKALAGGIQFITDYDPKIKYSCEMDGQSVRINYTEQDIPNSDQGSLKSSGTGRSNQLTFVCLFVCLFTGFLPLLFRLKIK